MSDADIAYYRARAIKEREHALASHRQNVAEVHLELARLYDALVSEPAIRPMDGLSNSRRRQLA